MKKMFDYGLFYLKGKNKNDTFRWEDIEFTSKVWFMIKNPTLTIKELKEVISYKMFNIEMWLTVQELYLSCYLWKFRGLETCEEHGFHAQSWLTGKCNKCKN